VSFSEIHELKEGRRLVTCIELLSLSKRRGATAEGVSTQRDACFQGLAHFARLTRARGSQRDMREPSGQPLLWPCAAPRPPQPHLAAIQHPAVAADPDPASGLTPTSTRATALVAPFTNAALLPDISYADRFSRRWRRGAGAAGHLPAR
jgi:hypothetical protein